MTQKTQRISAALVAALLALISFGCTSAPVANSNSSVNANANANANANEGATANANSAPTGAASPFSAREPERYSAKIVISAQGEVNGRQGSTQWEIDFGRMDANRRWSVKVPGLNQEVIYLEKPGLKYLVLPARNQYVELTPDALGFPLGNLLTPSAMMERLKSRAAENLGVEPVNGRPATKYKFAGAANTGTQAGTVQTDSIVYIDEETGLPLRADLTAVTSGSNARAVLETRDIHLNPDPALFEVPSGYKKVTSEELKQQVQNFITLVRAIAPYLGQQIAVEPPPTGTAPASNSNRPAGSANANRP
ncbi:MAG TPA: hypothetical protein VJZ26_19400 [Blastocatellia bacterium]|nr:hypothetical protein [Blastocatellia bacterium]